MYPLILVLSLFHTILKITLKKVHIFCKLIHFSFQGKVGWGWYTSPSSSIVISLDLVIFKKSNKSAVIFHKFADTSFFKFHLKVQVHFMNLFSNIYYYGSLFTPFIYWTPQSGSHVLRILFTIWRLTLSSQCSYCKPSFALQWLPYKLKIWNQEKVSNSDYDINLTPQRYFDLFHYFFTIWRLSLCSHTNWKYWIKFRLATKFIFQN
jgi:hypothetical protein